MSLAIEDLAASQPLAPGAVERFLEGKQVPLVEGGRVTFLWRGEARSVRLQHWIHGLAGDVPLVRLEGSDLWYLTVDLPEGSRVEYKFLVESRRGHELLRDPLNPHLATDPFGANSVAGVGYQRPTWSLPQEGVPEGRLEECVVDSAVFGGRRTLRVYLPARYRRSARYPLLLAHDGSDYLRFSQLGVVLDNLIHALEIPPLVVGLLDPDDRLVEYAADARQGRHVVDEVLPALSKRYSLVDRPDARGLMGASFGAVATLATAYRHPCRGPAFAPVVEFMNGFRKAPTRCADKLFVSCGVYESLIYENRSLVPLLDATGMRLRYVEAFDGHNWENWRDRLREGLSWLFPGPLWMVYE